MSWFWYHDMDAGDSRVKRVLALLRRGHQHYVPSSGAKRQGKPNERGHYCSEWIKSYIVDYGDQMPTVCLFRLDPVKLKDVHQEYSNETTRLEFGRPLKYAWFCNLWRERFKLGLVVDAVQHKIDMRPGL